MTEPQPSPAPRRARILVVDDEPSNVDVIRQFLKIEGYEVVEAVDGEDALDRVRGDSPDLILLDIMMPRLDGYEVCRRLKSDAATVFLPIVLLTALKGTMEKIKGVEVGADDFLTKPFNHLELVTRVKSLLRVKHLHDELEAHRRDLEQRVAERTAELRQALTQLRELDRLKSEFISRVSHELRTPLLHVKGYVSLLADETLGPLNPEQSEGLQTAIKATEHLEQLVQDVVDFGGAGIERMDLQAVRLDEAAQAAIDLIQHLVRAQNSHVAVEIADATPMVRADRRALIRTLRHLLDNAVKFSPPRSTVRLQAEAVNDGSQVRISIRDQGIGIPQEELGRIFQAFYQVDGSATRRYGGSGIGLALVKLLLEAQGSAIRAESTEGAGSTFYFDLPVASPRPAQ